MLLERNRVREKGTFTEIFHCSLMFVDVPLHLFSFCPSSAYAMNVQAMFLFLVFVKLNQVTELCQHSELMLERKQWQICGRRLQNMPFFLTEHRDREHLEAALSGARDRIKKEKPLMVRSHLQVLPFSPFQLSNFKSNLLVPVTDTRMVCFTQLGMMPYFEYRNLVTSVALVLPVVLTLFNGTGNAGAKNDGLMNVLKMVIQVVLPGSDQLLTALGM